MNQKPSYGIAGTKYYFPNRAIPTKDLAKQIGIEQRIVNNIGIEQVFVEDHMNSAEMGTKVTMDLLEELNILPSQIDMMIVTNCFREKQAWSCAAKISNELGLNSLPVLDIDQACNSFIPAMEIARNNFISDISINNILYVNCEKYPFRYIPGLSFYTDGAAAVLFQRGDTRAVPLSLVHQVDGSYVDQVYILSGRKSVTFEGSFINQSQKEEASDYYLKLFRVLIDKTETTISIALEKANCAIEDIDLFIPNNTTMAVPMFLQDRLGIDKEKIFIENIPMKGHIGPSDLIVNLHDVIKNKIDSNEIKVCFISYGAGLFVGSSVIQIN